MATLKERCFELICRFKEKCKAVSCFDVSTTEICNAEALKFNGQPKIQEPKEVVEFLESMECQSLPTKAKFILDVLSNVSEDYNLEVEYRYQKFDRIEPCQESFGRRNRSGDFSKKKQAIIIIDDQRLRAVFLFQRLNAEGFEISFFCEESELQGWKDEARQYLRDFELLKYVSREDFSCTAGNTFLKLEKWMLETAFAKVCSRLIPLSTSVGRLPSEEKSAESAIQRLRNFFFALWKEIFSPQQVGEIHEPGIEVIEQESTGNSQTPPDPEQDSTEDLPEIQGLKSLEALERDVKEEEAKKHKQELDTLKEAHKNEILNLKEQIQTLESEIFGLKEKVENKDHEIETLRQSKEVSNAVEEFRKRRKYDKSS